MVPYRQRVQAYLTKSVDSLFRTIQFSNGVVRAMDKVVLSDLKDVSNTAPGDGDVLEWSAAQGKWVPGPGGGGVIPTLQQVMDQGAAYSGTNNFSMASATSNVTDQGFNLALGNASGSLSSASVYAAQSLHHLSTGTSGTAELVLDANGSVDLNWKSGANASGFTIDGTQMLVTDANNTKGLEYAADYSSSFTTYSLVDKNYVDTEIAGIGTPTLQQVMGEGATYTGTNNFTIKTAPSTGTDFAMVATYGNKEIVVTSKDGTRESELNLQGNTALISRSIPSTTNPNARQRLVFIGDTPSSYKMEVEDQAASKGLEYAGAYKANFTQYSLVDKDYVDTQISGISGVSATHVPVMNAAGTSYIDSPLISDGTTVGLNTSLWSGSLFNANTNGTEVYVMNVSRSTSASAGERTTMLVDAGSGGATNDNISLRASATIGAAGSNSVALQGVSRGILSPSAAGITDASIGVYGYAGNGSANSSNEAIGGLFAAAVADGGLPIGVYSTTYGGAGTAEVKLFYGTTSVSNSADNIGMKINVSNSGSGSAYSLQLIDGTQGANKFLKSDANGKASWADVPAGGATSIGELSDAATPATDNVGLGSGALSSITTGDYNVAVGVNAGLGALGASRCVFIGNDAGRNITGRSDCVAIGEGAMGVGTGGNTNIAVGANALSGVTGQGNVGIGNSAGSSITSGQWNLFLGRNANGLNTQSYQIAIGTSVTTTQASSLALGRSGSILLHGEFATAGRTKLGVNLGNTYSTPTANLHVKGNASDTTTFLVQNGAGSSILQANQNGNIGIGNNTPTEKLDVSGNLKVDGQAYSSTHTLTAGATVTPDFDNGNVQTVTLDQATTLGNPTNLKDGATYIVIVKQPAAANHTLAFGTAYKFEGGTAPTITAANGATDVLTFVSDGTNLYGAAALNFS